MSSTTTRLDQRRAAKNQSLFRDVNKRVNDINKALDLWVTLSDWFCECPTDKCTTRIALTPQQYEAARANPTHFIVAPNRDHLVLGPGAGHRPTRALMDCREGWRNQRPPWPNSSIHASQQLTTHQVHLLVRLLQLALFPSGPGEQRPRGRERAEPSRPQEQRLAVAVRCVPAGAVVGDRSPRPPRRSCAASRGAPSSIDRPVRASPSRRSGRRAGRAPGSPSWERSPSSTPARKRSQAGAIRCRSLVGKSTTTLAVRSRASRSISDVPAGRVAGELEHVEALHRLGDRVVDLVAGHLPVRPAPAPGRSHTAIGETNPSSVQATSAVASRR